MFFFHYSFSVYIIQIFFKGLFRIRSFELHILFSLYIVSCTFANVWYFLFDINSHHYLPYCPNQKLRGFTPDMAFSSLFNINSLPSPLMSTFRIILRSFASPLTISPPFFSLCYCKYLPPVFYYVQFSYFISHSPCYQKVFFQTLK